MVNNETKLLKAGDCFYVEPHMTHGAVCKKKGILIDTFSPVREDLIPK
jgi:quercetin dioxygenase-like cupin family protein